MKSTRPVSSGRAPTSTTTMGDTLPQSGAPAENSVALEQLAGAQPQATGTIPLFAVSGFAPTAKGPQRFGMGDNGGPALGEARMDVSAAVQATGAPPAEIAKWKVGLVQNATWSQRTGTYLDDKGVQTATVVDGTVAGPTLDGSPGTAPWWDGKGSAQMRADGIPARVSMWDAPGTELRWRAEGGRLAKIRGKDQFVTYVVARQDETMATQVLAQFAWSETFEADNVSEATQSADVKGPGISLGATGPGTGSPVLSGSTANQVSSLTVVPTKKA